MRIELHYFEGCPSWQVADDRLREALAAAGHADVTVERVLVATPEQAEELGFCGSPTVLLDGVDPFAVPGAAVGFSCRLYRTPSGLGGSPSVEQLVEVLRAR